MGTRLRGTDMWSQFTGGIGRSFEIRFRRPVWPERGGAVVVLTAEMRGDDDTVVVELSNESVLPPRAGTSCGALA